jgi:hypothetical protein
MKTMLRAMVLVALVILMLGAARGQATAAASGAMPAASQAAAADRDLFATVAALDKKLFDAYNTCDLQTMGAMLEDGLEFYHDQTGLMVGRQPFLDAIKQNICGKVQRTLVPGTLEVYPLQGYGAVEIGVHRFTHPGDPGPGGEGKFVTVWENKNGTWKIARAISFDHHSLVR